jgi:hypothetical protein
LSNTNLGLLPNVLRQLGVQTVYSSTFQGGSSLHESLITEIQRSDFICIVLEKREQSGSVLFEAGIATALRKPLLVFAPSKGELPASLTDIPYVVTDLQRREALLFQLEGFIETIVLEKHELRRGITPAREATIPRAQLAGGSALEKEVAGLLQEAGANLVYPPRTGEPWSPDMAAWFPGLGVGFNPVLVEVASNRKQGPEQEQRLRGVLAERGLLLGLLVAKGDPPASDFALDEGSGILWISIDQLREEAPSGRLIKKLLSVRNRVVHGAR